MDYERSFSSRTEDETRQDEEIEDEGMTILEHLEELRRRLIWILVAVAVGTVVSLVTVTQAFEFLLGPAPDNFKPVYTGMTEMFSTYVKVALFTGVILAMPVIVYHVAAFVAPGLTKQEKRYLMMLIPGVFVAFIIGIAFSYYIVTPFATRYLLTTDIFTGIADPMIRVSDYIEFVVNLLLAIGVSFELPIVVFFLAKIGIVNTEKLSRYRKYALLLAVTAAAIITPTPDPGTQMLVAIPIYFLYELGVLLSRIA